MTLEAAKKIVLRPLAPTTYLLRNAGKTLPLTGAIMLAVLLVAGIVAMINSIPYSIRSVYLYGQEFLAAGPRGDPTISRELAHTIQTESPVPIERIAFIRSAPSTVKSIVGSWPFIVVGFEHEAANLDASAIALAACASGGKVIVQVKERLPRGALKAREVRIPAAWVTAIVVDPDQRTSYDIPFDASLSGELTGPERLAIDAQETRTADGPGAEPFSERQAVARRAACELFQGAVVNYGVGVPDAVAKLVVRRGELGCIHQTIEHGTYGGSLLDGVLFGYARNATAMLDAPTQFDFYAGGGLDIAFLGFGEFDAQGNVNVSRLGGLTVGPGGFIDIAQNARKVVFCGTFSAKGVQLHTGDGQMRVAQQGAVRKLVQDVEQITFSGPQALVRGQQVLYLTERASFRLMPEGVELFELAPGVDLQRDVLDQMEFSPRIAPDVQVMSSSFFCV